MLPRPTIVDVAREAGVAISTASAALNERNGVSPATRTRVKETAEKLGFVPSIRGRSLSSRKTFSVGLVLERDSRVLEADPFFWGFVGGVESVLQEHGYSLVLQTAPSEALMVERTRTLALGRGIDGIFLADVRVNDRRFDLVQELGLPTVALNVDPARSPVSTANQDHETALRELLGRLIDLGHTRIAHVSGTPGFVHSEHREGIWREMLAANGLSDDLLFVGDFSMASGVNAANELLSRPDPPTAIFSANDLAAVGFLAGAGQRRLRAPSAYSITGFEGIALGEFTTPALTTAVTSPYDLGATAATMLLGLVAGGPRTDETIEPAKALWRSSVGKAPAGAKVSNA